MFLESCFSQDFLYSNVYSLTIQATGWKNRLAEESYYSMDFICHNLFKDENSDLKDSIHKEFPKTCAPDDFFGQVKRTINGKPVPQEQIDMIVAAINSGLELSSQDILLDIGCGNGALSQYLFEKCEGFLGVDFSSYLVEIAKTNFEQLPRYEFLLLDAAAYVSLESNPERFSKALCYGVFSYFSPTVAETVLTVLAQRFTGVERLFIGNLPDPERAHRFFPEGKDFRGLLDERDSPLGIWRSMDIMGDLAERTGWKAEFQNMPEEFYASHYRFDAILTRQAAKQS